jgi:hypothetical protein
MNSLIKHFKKLIKSCLVLLLTTLVMLIFFAPPAGASNGSSVSLDKKLDLALKDLNLDEDSVEDLISGRKTKGDSEILLISKKKKKPAKKKAKKSKAAKKKGRNPQTGAPIKIKGRNVIKFKPGKKLK